MIDADQQAYNIGRGLGKHMKKAAKSKKSSTDDAARFIDRVFVRCPASLPPLISRAAAKDLTTPSEYVRRSIINRLKADGILK